MQERNRTFGRVSRPVDKASAPRQAVAKQRKPGRTKHAAAVAPKPPRGRTMPLAVTKSAPTVLEIDTTIQHVNPAEASVLEHAAVLPEAASLEVVPIVEAAEVVPSIDPPFEIEAPRAAPDAPLSVFEADRSVPTIGSVPELSVSMDPLTRPTPSRPARAAKRAAKRRPIVRMAVAASVAAACLVTLSHFSDAHLPTPAVFSLAAPTSASDEAKPVGEVVPRKAVIALLPTDVAILPPVTASAAYGTDDLVEAATLPPAAGERVTARAAVSEKAEAPAARVAAPRKPNLKQVAARNAAPRAPAEAARQPASRGPILDFLSDLIP